MSELWLPKEVSVDYYKDYSEEGDCSGLVTALAAVRSIDYDTETSSVRYSMITGNRGTHADLMMCAGGVDGRYFALPAGMAYRSGMVNGSRCVGGRLDMTAVVYGKRGESLPETALDPEQTRQILKLGACIVGHALSMPKEGLRQWLDSRKARELSPGKISKVYEEFAKYTSEQAMSR